tara:strand:+ start:527 stop:838 length:312 start_codon:yes stop_codon:yes gene_type:complete
MNKKNKMKLIKSLGSALAESKKPKSNMNKRQGIFEYSYPLQHLLNEKQMTTNELAEKLNRHKITVHRWAISTRLIDYSNPIDERLKLPETMHENLYKKLFINE